MDWSQHNTITLYGPSSISDIPSPHFIPFAEWSRASWIRWLDYSIAPRGVTCCILLLTVQASTNLILHRLVFSPSVRLPLLPRCQLITCWYRWTWASINLQCTLSRLQLNLSVCTDRCLSSCTVSKGWTLSYSLLIYHGPDTLLMFRWHSSLNALSFPFRSLAVRTFSALRTGQSPMSS